MEYYNPFEYVEEYDPVYNWKIDFDAIAAAASISELCAKVAPFVQDIQPLKTKIIQLRDKMSQPVSNMSALYVAHKMRIREPKAKIHHALRQLQLADLGADMKEYNDVTPRVTCIRAVKEYIKTKDIYNLSPDWLIRLTKMRGGRADLLAAMKSIDCFTALKNGEK